jgi:hypothetical protein
MAHLMQLRPLQFTRFTKFTGWRTVQTKSSFEGLKEGWTRATFILREDYLDKIKSLAYWRRKNIKEVMDEVLEEYLKGKKIKSRRNK